MSDYMEKILEVHWRYVECDDSPQKLQLKYELEAMMKEYLSMQPHDKKFFLGETQLVLKKTVRELDGFSAHQAMLGFEAISQYANNLYTKPWRKEYAILKLYSGFYQHEVKSNLMEPEILFEAMGYRCISDDMLVMEGPICPDQVMNVSRDAMLAYVECQIMKEIFGGVSKMGFDVSWQDVYTMREKYPGGVKQGIHRLGYSMHDRYVRKEKLVDIDNNYTQPSAAMPCQSCAYQTPAPLVVSSSCAVHGPQVCSCQGGGRSGRVPSYASVAGSHMHSPQMQAAGYMTHSRSLDQYNPDGGCMHQQQHQPPQRHSFDLPMQASMPPPPVASNYHHYQQIPATVLAHSRAHAHHTYEQPYDTLNGGGSINSSVSYADVSGGGVAPYGHPYNVSGNRYPLPYPISEMYANVEPPAASYGMKPAMAGYNARTLHKQQQHMHPHYSSVPPMPPARQQSSMLAARDLGMMHHQQQQRLAAAEHLIDFNEQAQLTSHDFQGLNHYHEAAVPRGMDHLGRVQNSVYDQPDGRAHGNGPLVDMTYDNCTYAKPMPRATRGKASSNATDKYLAQVADNLQDMTLTDNNRKMPLNGVTSKMPAHHGLEREISEYSGESLYTDQLANTDSSGELALKMGHKSPSQEVKNQDGKGTFGEWNFVYNKLEKNGYRKDVEGRDDLLQSMDLDSSPAAHPRGAPEKRRSIEAKAEAARLQMASVATNTEPPVLTAAMEAKANKAKQERSILKQPPANTIQPPPAYQNATYASAAAQAASLSSTTGAIKKQKSALKPSIITTVTPPTPTLTAASQAQDNKNGNEASGRATGARAKQTKTATTKAATAASAATNGSSCRTREWNCPHCTYTNNSATHICEVCCRTDIPPPAMSATKPTCV